MSKKKESLPEESTPAKPTLTPKRIVMRVLGVGDAAAEGVLRRMGAKADELPAKYSAGEARDFITAHNVKTPTAPVAEAEPFVEPIPEQESTPTP